MTIFFHATFHPSVCRYTLNCAAYHYNVFQIVHAGRKKANKSLFTMQQSESPPIEGFSIEVESALRAHELVSSKPEYMTTR